MVVQNTRRDDSQILRYAEHELCCVNENFFSKYNIVKVLRFWFVDWHLARILYMCYIFIYLYNNVYIKMRTKYGFFCGFYVRRRVQSERVARFIRNSTDDPYIEFDQCFYIYCYLCACICLWIVSCGEYQCVCMTCPFYSIYNVIRRRTLWCTGFFFYIFT